MNISKAAAQSGLQATTIRYYEQIGLISSSRRDNGYRDYTPTDVDQLRFVHQARNLGFDIEECRRLLALYTSGHEDKACVRALAEQHLDAVDQKIRELKAMRTTLSDLVERCRTTTEDDCPILEGLAAKPGN
ncbi:MAG TPA: MerR family DNA-binding protein [Hyphomicrobiaceae bacterium]|nr:MerR family DNA-binding protein [Hyphomicrobiaceae bacterium]